MYSMCTTLKWFFEGFLGLSVDVKADVVMCVWGWGGVNHVQKHKNFWTLLMGDHEPHGRTSAKRTCIVGRGYGSCVYLRIDFWLIL